MPKNLYSLAVDNRNVCTVQMDVPAWFPVCPKLNRRWLKTVLEMALRNCLGERS